MRQNKMMFIIAILILSLIESQSAFAQQERYRVVTRIPDSTLLAKLPRPHFKSDSLIQVNWSKLAGEMTMAQVDSLLGSPQGFDVSVDRAIAFWTYKRGELTFNNISRTLIGWDK